MVYFGPGSDWNPETDGEPICICEIEGEHHHTVEELMARDEYYRQQSAERVSPDTGEPPVVGICGGITLVLIAIIAFGRRFA